MLIVRLANLAGNLSNVEIADFRGLMLDHPVLRQNKLAINAGKKITMPVFVVAMPTVKCQSSIENGHPKDITR